MSNFYFLKEVRYLFLDFATNIYDITAQKRYSIILPKKYQKAKLRD